MCVHVYMYIVHVYTHVYIAIHPAIREQCGTSLAVSEATKKKESLGTHADTTRESDASSDWGRTPQT